MYPPGFNVIMLIFKKKILKVSERRKDTFKKKYATFKRREQM